MAARRAVVAGTEVELESSSKSSPTASGRSLGVEIVCSSVDRIQSDDEFPYGRHHTPLGEQLSDFARAGVNGPLTARIVLIVLNAALTDACTI